MNQVEGCVIGTLDGLFREPNLRQGVHIVSPRKHHWRSISPSLESLRGT